MIVWGDGFVGDSFFELLEEGSHVQEDSAKDVMVLMVLMVRKRDRN